jgi:3-deoxy-D-manno-octulosonate 8-phosphate phosphatase (KDO 8-P phosphatase)
VAHVPQTPSHAPTPPGPGKGAAPPKSGVRLFVMDVDGTLTDGTITYGDDGGETKSFHARDGAGIHLLKVAGIEAAIVTGRTSAAVTRRAAELGIHEVVQGVKDKAMAVRSLRYHRNLGSDAVGYVGDDLSDLLAMREAAFSAAPADAAAEVRRIATFVCTKAGGRGAVREAIETLLRREGRWDDILASFGAVGPVSR